VHDLFSAFYPLGAASPVMQRLALTEHGLTWRRAPVSLAHPLPDGRCAVLSTALGETAQSLDELAPGDGDAWRALYAGYERVVDPVLDVMTSPIPPVRGLAKLVATLGPRGMLEFARTGVLSVRRLAQEHFASEGAALLFTGNALHSDVSLDATPSGFLGWLLTCLGQQHGFPVPEGGAGRLTDALVERLRSRGGAVQCNRPVAGIVVRDGRAVAVRFADGSELAAPRGVIADVGAPALYRELVGEEHLPAPFVRDLGRFQYDSATFKVDWALSGPIPWRVEGARRAGVVHVCESMDLATAYSASLASDQIPDRPFVLVGQMNKADPTRSPAGTETVWAYTHVPREPRADARPHERGGGVTGKWDASDVERFTARVEDEIEAHAPGFRALITGRHVLSPPALEARNANLVGGSLGGGTMALWQQLVFRPAPGLGRAETPVRGLFLGSASAHPGGGVHGACGANAARAAIAADRVRRALRRPGR
jgi:phytoene dehydrogenase-like protein